MICRSRRATSPGLYAIAANVIADQYRSTRRRHDLGLRLAHEARAEAPGSDPAESLALREAFSRMAPHSHAGTSDLSGCMGLFGVMSGNM